MPKIKTSVLFLFFCISTLDLFAVECPVTVTGNAALVFGYLSAPGNGFCDYWTVSAVDGGGLTHSGAGNGVDFILTDHSKGAFKLNGR